MSTLTSPQLSSYSNFIPKMQSLPFPRCGALTFHFNSPNFTPKIPSLPSFLYHSIRPGCEGYVYEDTTDTQQKRTFFLTNDEVKKVEYLDKFTYTCKLPSGYLTIRAMKESELDMVVGLLAESFAESMLLPSMYLTILGFLIRQYLVERRGLAPHAVTLLGFYRDGHGGGGGDGVFAESVEVSFNRSGGDVSGGSDSGGDDSSGGGVFAGSVEVPFNRRGGGDGGAVFAVNSEVPFNKRGSSGGGGDDDGVFAGTVEVSFNKRGASASPPSPTPPKDCPYICNMTVHKSLRRKGIGWHLLKASEELISTMTSSRKVYLHCRMIDIVPLNMYKKAGYDIIKTDSLLILLTLQRRKHLMCKELPVASECRGMFDVEKGVVEDMQKSIDD